MRRCWEPSCRLRSSRRRSLSPASTTRARDARSSRSWASSSACSRSFSSAKPAAADDLLGEHRVVEQAAPVDQRRHRLPAADQRGHRPAVGRVQLGGNAVGVDVLAVADRVDEVELGVAEDTGDRVAEATVAAGTIEPQRDAGDHRPHPPRAPLTPRDPGGDQRAARPPRRASAAAPASPLPMKPTSALARYDHATTAR